jgi:hypothetical protein
MKCVPHNSTQLLYWQNFECLGKIGERGQSSRVRYWQQGGLTHLVRVLTKVANVDLPKVLKGEC